MNTKEIDIMAERFRGIVQDIHSGMGFSIDIAQAVEGQDDEKKVKELEDTMREYVNLEETIKLHTTALTGLKRHINQDFFQLGEAYKKARESDKDLPDFTAHPKFKEFKHKVWAVKHPDEAMPEEEDEDLVEVRTQDDTSQYICPLTRKELEDPVKNVDCGHHYSREAILHYFKTSKPKRGTKYPCPVAGCSAELNEKTIEKDLEMERQLRRHKQRGGTTSRRKKPEEEDVTNID